MMNTKEPTQEQIKEFWEWCGLCFSTKYPDTFYPYCKTYRRKSPPIDLNNLFKYAVPKVRYQVILKNIRDGWHCMLFNSEQEPPRIEATDCDPALALFWAIWQVKEIK